MNYIKSWWCWATVYDSIILLISGERNYNYMNNYFTHNMTIIEFKSSTLKELFLSN